LFERSEGSTYLYFGEIPNSLPPPPFGELEDVYYSGGHNPISYEVLLDFYLLYKNISIYCSLFNVPCFSFHFLSKISMLHHIVFHAISVKSPTFDRIRTEYTFISWGSPHLKS
jgi:hypothetical protein